jgi:hypothetical protein
LFRVKDPASVYGSQNPEVLVSVKNHFENYETTNRHISATDDFLAYENMEITRRHRLHIPFLLHLFISFCLISVHSDAAN